MKSIRFFAIAFLVICMNSCGPDTPKVQPDPASTAENSETEPTISTFTTRPLVIAFARDDSIWIMRHESRGIASGRDPEVSPDGGFVAFTEQEKNGDRFIAIIDTASWQIRRLRSVPGRNSFQPHWAPDGKRLAFHYFTENRWKIGLIEADDTGFKQLDVSIGGDTPERLYSLCWSHGGNALLCHDLRFLYEIDLDGRLLSTLPLGKLLGPDSVDYSISGESRLVTSREENLIFCDAGGKESPIRSVFRYDRRAKRARMVSPSSYFAKTPAILPNDRALFISGFELTETNRTRILAKRPVRTSIYTIDTDGSDLKVVIRNAGYPSTSR